MERTSGNPGRRLRTVVMLAMALAMSFAAGVLSATADAPPETPGLPALMASGVVDPALAAEVTASGGVDAILLLDDRAILEDSARARSARSIVDDDATIMAARVVALSTLKSSVRAVAGDGMTVLSDYEHFATLHVRFESAEAMTAAANDPRTRSIRPDLQFERNLGESLGLINQPPAQLSGRTGAGTAVAVLDSGLDYLSPHFGCTAVAVPAETCRVIYAQDFAADDGVRDDDFHGTNVAAIVSAVADEARIIGLDVFDGSSASTSTILAALDFVIATKDTYNTRAVNMSFGETGSRYTAECTGSPFESAVANLRSAGILPVFSAGNSANSPAGRNYRDGIAMPACTPGAISVGAVYDSDLGRLGWGNCLFFETTAPDKITCFSQSAPILSIYAPGALIDAASTLFGGTSQAAPHVAGAIAVLAAAVPAQSVDERQAVLTGSGPVIHDVRPVTPRTVHRLDLCAALVAAGSDCVAGPSNDSLANAFGVTTNPALFRHSTLGFSSLGDLYDIEACTDGNLPPGAGAWYRIDTQSAGILDVTTGDSTMSTPKPSANAPFTHRTVLVIYEDVEQLNLLACNDGVQARPEDRLAELHVQLEAGKSYLVTILSYEDNPGGYAVVNMSYSGELLPLLPTVALAFSAQPQDFRSGVATFHNDRGGTPVEVEARTEGGAKNTRDVSAVHLDLVRTDGQPGNVAAFCTGGNDQSLDDGAYRWPRCFIDAPGRYRLRAVHSNPQIAPVESDEFRVYAWSDVTRVYGGKAPANGDVPIEHGQTVDYPLSFVLPGAVDEVPPNVARADMTFLVPNSLVIESCAPLLPGATCDLDSATCVDAANWLYHIPVCIHFEQQPVDQGGMPVGLTEDAPFAKLRLSNARDELETAYLQVGAMTCEDGMGIELICQPTLSAVSVIAPRIATSLGFAGFSGPFTAGTGYETIQVMVRDQLGQPLETAGQAITLALDVPGILACNEPLTQPATQGRAYWHNCVIVTAGTYQLTASATGVTSAVFYVTVNGLIGGCSGLDDAADALQLLRILAGLAEPSWEGCEGDADGDTTVGVSDVLLIRRRAAGLE